MGPKVPHWKKLYGTLLFLSIALELQCASLEDIFNLSQQPRSEREIPFYENRYISEPSEQKVISRPIKPEDAPEARDRDANIGKRCIRCDYNRDYYYRDYRAPTDYRTRYDERYDDRVDDRYYRGDYRDNRDRYDDRGRDRYDDRSRDRYYDDYDKRYYDNSRRYNDYNDRRYDDRDRYDRDRYDRRQEYYDTYDRDRYDREDRYKYYDTRYNRGGYRPWDETTKGRPEYNTGYATNWNNYDDRNSSRDRWREQGFSSSSYRPRDPYDSGYRGTSYLYGRPSSTTTTQSPSSLGGNTVTDNPESQSNTSSG